MKPTVIFMLFLCRFVEFTLTLEKCSKLPSVQHAFVLDEYKKTEYQIGDVIYFCCDPGFTTGLNTTYICTEDGWTAAAIGQCVDDSFQVLRGCTPPPPLTNGHLLEDTILIYGNGARIRYRCEDHHTMSGGLFKTCTNGQWTGDIKCIPVTCTVRDPPSGTTYYPRDKIIFTSGESVNVTCGENLWVKSTELQTAQLFCESTGRRGSWDFTPVCQQVKCFKEDPLVTRWDQPREGSADIDETLQYECHQDFEAVARDNRARCTRQGWQPHPLCKDPQSCGPPPSLDNGDFLASGGTFSHNSQVEYQCQDKYIMEGGPHKTCLNGVWTGDIKCLIIDCGEPEPLLNGGVSFVSGERNEYGSIIQYHCNEPYYSLRGAVNVNFSCEADQKWRAIDDSELKPICIPVCGKPQVRFQDFQRIIAGDEAPHGSIPWQVRLTSSESRSGGGMLISDQWVLTTAHFLCPKKCPIANNTVKIFWGSNTVQRVPNAIAASLHLHPGYNNYDQLHFDNDIALIKLPEPITFNQYVMPICLPSEVHSFRDGDVGVVSGFGLTRTEEKGYFLTKNLTYVRLPVVNPRKCTESLEKYKRKHPGQPMPEESSNMFCAGFSDGAKDSCHGDGGGPFALWRTDHYWVAGIISWGIACAEEGTYGFYTRVQNYVDWIHKTMNEN